MICTTNIINNLMKKRPACLTGILLLLNGRTVSKDSKNNESLKMNKSLPLSFARRLPFSTLVLISFLGFMSCTNQSKENTSTRQEEPTAKPLDSSDRTKTILFFGNSLTAGYGVEPEEAYPALIQDKIDSLNLKYKVINAGVSGETTSGGNSRIDWILKQHIDIFVLELGANDGLRGIPLETTENNLQAMIDKVRSAYPKVKIILEGMQIPPNMGADYTSKFKDIYPKLAKENNTELVPFLLTGVAGDPKLNQQDGIHPTAEGHKILAENVWKVLKKDL